MDATWIPKYLNVDGLRKRIGELEQQIGPLQRELDELCTFLSLYEQAASVAKGEGPSASPALGGCAEEAPAAPPPPARRPLALGGESLAEAGIQVLQEATGAMNTSEIVEKLAGRAIEPRGENKVQTLYAALHRMRQFRPDLKKVGRGMWSVERRSETGEEEADAD